MRTMCYSSNHILLPKLLLNLCGSGSGSGSDSCVGKRGCWLLSPSKAVPTVVARGLAKAHLEPQWTLMKYSKTKVQQSRCFVGKGLKNILWQKNVQDIPEPKPMEEDSVSHSLPNYAICLKWGWVNQPPNSSKNHFFHLGCGKSEIPHVTSTAARIVTLILWKTAQIHTFG